MHFGRVNDLAHALLVTAGQEDKVIFGECEPGRYPGMRFANAASHIRLCGDHVVVGGFGLTVGAEESTNNTIKHLGIAPWGFAIFGGKLDVEASLGEDLVRNCGFYGDIRICVNSVIEHECKTRRPMRSIARAREHILGRFHEGKAHTSGVVPIVRHRYQDFRSSHCKGWTLLCA